MRRGTGDGTTRRQYRPSGLTVHPAGGREPLGLSFVIHGSDELGRLGERRILNRHQGLGDEGRDLPAREGVLQRLEKPVSDHPLRLGSEYVEGVGPG